jgi:hypothetical protein
MVTNINSYRVCRDVNIVCLDEDCRCISQLVYVWPSSHSDAAHEFTHNELDTYGNIDRCRSSLNITTIETTRAYFVPQHLVYHIHQIQLR